MLRRQRGGQKLLLEHLWPKLKMIVSCDYRMTTTGLHSDYILPAAQHYEKLGYSMPSVHHLNYVLCDRATQPMGESLPDVEIGLRMIGAIEKQAAKRGLKEYKDRKGNLHSLENLLSRVTFDGAIGDEETRFREGVLDNAVYGILPKGTTLETLREKGQVRFTNWGMVGHGISQASTIRPDEVHNPLRWHTEDKIPYDTLVRRAQYYIDHEWFLEAGEELPTHKETPNAGGAGRRFQMTSGHNRWSIHSMNLTNNVIQNTHRGEPFVFINDTDAADLGVENGEQVRLVSDVGDCLLAAKLTPSCRPGQVILYNGFEPYMHENWYSQSDLETGHVKHLGMVGNYGHLTYRVFSWQPIPADRAVRVDVEKVG
jgi:nitrate reductase alpha subunit